MAARQEDIRIGIDFGHTIGLIEEGPAPFAYEMIAHLVHKFGEENLFIVSRAGPNMEVRIRAFLEETGFFDQCCFLRQHVIFVREYAGKAYVVRALGISIFFDDHTKVVRVLSPLPQVQRIFWMHANPRELQLIQKPYRNKIAITSNWKTTMRFFQRFPSKHLEETPQPRRNAEGDEGNCQATRQH